MKNLLNIGCFVLVAVLCSAAAPLLPPPSGSDAAASASLESPIDFFRELLGMNAREREEALATKHAWQRRIIKEKIIEYEALSVEERELRLKTTELRWYLKKLVPMEAGKREVWLDGMSAHDRPLIEARLEQWDQLSPGWQREILAYERTMAWFHRVESMTPREKAAAMNAQPPDVRADLERRMAAWQSLSKERRRGMAGDFQRFFQLSASERKEVMAALSPEERRRVEPTIEKFASLAPGERIRCIESLTRFASLPEADRRRLMRNQEKWHDLTNRERETMRNLVTKFPPLPPGLNVRPPLPPSSGTDRFPPLPPGLDVPTMPPVLLSERR